MRQKTTTSTSAMTSIALIAIQKPSALCTSGMNSKFMIAAAQVPAPPEIAARSYLLLDVTANQILAQKDIDSPVEPASLTKLMSAYVVFDALRAKKITLTQTLPVSPRAWKMPGSRMASIDASLERLGHGPSCLRSGAALFPCGANQQPDADIKPIHGTALSRIEKWQKVNSPAPSRT